MLQEDRCRERIDIACAVLRPSAELPDSSQRDSCRVPLVDEEHGKSGARLECRAHRAHLTRPIRLAPRFIERQAGDETFCVERLRAPDDFSDRRPFSRASEDMSRRRSDRARWIADREAYSAFAPVDREVSR